MRKLKICHIITRMIVGGAQENTLLSILGHLENGHDALLVTGPSPGPEGELLKKKDIPDFEIIENPHLIRAINPYHDFFAYSFLVRFFRERQFDVVHTHSSKAGIIGRMAAHRAQVPFIAHTVHGQAFHRYEKPWRNFLFKKAEAFAAKKCDRIFAVAQAMIDQCVDAGVADRSKYKVVYSGMDLNPFLTIDDALKVSMRQKLNIPTDALVIGTIARLFPLKGYEFFLPVAEKIAAKCPNIYFLIVGNGIMMDDLQAQAKAKNLNFVFPGLIPPDEVYKYTAAMDMLVHLSLREGLPRAVVQAMASGIPAIGFALDGTPEVVINDETGYIVEPENVDGVVQAIEKLINDRKLMEALGQNGRKLVKEKFDWRKMADILEGEYLSGLTNRNSMITH